MIRPFLILTAALSLGAANAWPQQPAASPGFEFPSGPLLRSAPDFAQWTISFSYPEDQQAKDPNHPNAAPKIVATSMQVRPRTIVIIKTKAIIHEAMTTVGGTPSEDWQVNGNYYIKYPGNKIWSAYESTDPTRTGGKVRAELILPASGFRGLEWVNKDAYAGRAKTGFGDCLIFTPGGRDTLKGGALSKDRLDALPAVAYIDAETRLPVMVRARDETRVFTFTQPPPSSIQTLPDDLTAEITAGNALRAQRNAAPSREY